MEGGKAPWLVSPLPGHSSPRASAFSNCAQFRADSFNSIPLLCLLFRLERRLDLKQGGRRRGANLSSIALIASYGRHGSQGGSCRCCGCTFQFFFPCCRFQFTHYIQSRQCPGAIGMESPARQRAQVGSFGEVGDGPHPLVVQEGQHHRNAGR